MEEANLRNRFWPIEVVPVAFVVDGVVNRQAAMLTNRLTNLKPEEIVSVVDRIIDPGTGRLRAVRRIKYRLLRLDGELTLHCEVVGVEELASGGGILTEDNIEDGTNRVIENYGVPTDLYAAPKALSHPRRRHKRNCSAHRRHDKRPIGGSHQRGRSEPAHLR